MRIILMHNPKAGRGTHTNRDLMAALAKAGHRAICQVTKKSGYKKALQKPTDLVLAAGGDGTVGKISSACGKITLPSLQPIQTAALV